MQISQYQPQLHFKRILSIGMSSLCLSVINITSIFALYKHLIYIITDNIVSPCLLVLPGESTSENSLLCVHVNLDKATVLSTSCTEVTQCTAHDTVFLNCDSWLGIVEKILLLICW